MKCWICGGKATCTTEYTGKEYKMPIFNDCTYNKRCYCESCYEKLSNERNRDLSEYVRLRKKLMFQRAVNKLELQGIDLYDYQEAVLAVKEYIEENPDKFDSAYEVMAAIILIYHRIECKPQYPIGKYQVDFLLPLEEVVLEIDGERHRHTKTYDSRRDAFIRSKLGTNWRILRIDTDYLDQNADKLVEAIHKMSDYWSFGYS